MTDVGALDAGDATKIGVGVIIALLIAGFLLSLLITAIVARIVLLAVVIVLGALVWQQRTSIENKIDQHKCNLTFFGVHLGPPQKLTRYCS